MPLSLLPQNFIHDYWYFRAARLVTTPTTTRKREPQHSQRKHHYEITITNIKGDYHKCSFFAFVMRKRRFIGLHFSTPFDARSCPSPRSLYFDDDSASRSQFLATTYVIGFEARILNKPSQCLRAFISKWLLYMSLRAAACRSATHDFIWVCPAFHLKMPMYRHYAVSIICLRRGQYWQMHQPDYQLHV